MYAIIETGGKQIKVAAGDKIFVEKSRIAGHVVCDIGARKNVNVGSFLVLRRKTGSSWTNPDTLKINLDQNFRVMYNIWKR